MFEIVKKEKYGDKEGLLFLINQFQPLIRKYSRKLNYDGAETDLTINLIEVIKKNQLMKAKT